MYRNIIFKVLKNSYWVIPIYLIYVDYEVKRLARNSPPEFKFSTAEFIRKFGYDEEQHLVEFTDGMVNRVFRIVPRNKQERGPPVLLEPGFMSNSNILVMFGPKKDLAFILADTGYDVWLGNFRDHGYSFPSTHANISKLHNSGFHEIGYYDVAATIDYILENTENRRLDYIGMSIGATSLVTLLSTRPEFNQKIRHGLLLGFKSSIDPNIITPYDRAILDAFSNNIWFMRWLGICLVGRSPMRIGYATYLCESSWIFSSRCHDFFKSTMGWTLEPQQDMTYLKSSLIASHFPHGVPAGALEHLLQLNESTGFRMRDYGEAGNLVRYNAMHPPLYDASVVTAPIKIYLATQDQLVDYQKTLSILKNLKNVKGVHTIHGPFDHINFMSNGSRDTGFIQDILETLAETRH